MSGIANLGVRNGRVFDQQDEQPWQQDGSCASAWRSGVALGHQQQVGCAGYRGPLLTGSPP